MLTAPPNNVPKWVYLFQSDSFIFNPTWRDANNREGEMLLKLRGREYLHESKGYETVTNPGWEPEDLQSQ